MVGKWLIMVRKGSSWLQNGLIMGIMMLDL